MRALLRGVLLSLGVGVLATAVACGPLTSGGGQDDGGGASDASSDGALDPSTDAGGDAALHDAGDGSVVDGSVVDGSTLDGSVPPACAANTWCPVAVPPHPGVLFNVWGTSRDDLWIVGGDAFLHHTASGWSLTTAPSSARGVCGSAANDVWSTSSTNTSGGHLFHHVGAAWPEITPRPSIDILYGNCVAVSPTNVWFIDLYSAVHYDGASLTKATLDMSGETIAAFGNQAWAGGLGVINHYDGSTWTGSVNVGTDPQQFRGSWAGATDDVWMIATGLFAHWNGTTWTTTTPAHVGYFAVYGAASDDVWAVGLHYAAHWDGATWHEESVPSNTLLYGVWGDASGFWAVGGDQTVLFRGH